MVIRGNASELDELYKVRENYFDKGMPLDTIFLKKCIKSTNKTIVRLSKGILGTYFIENNNPLGENIWVELSIDFDSLFKTDWFIDKETLSHEFLVFDDLFRTCMVLKKYYFFHKILGSLYNPEIYLVHQTYNLYVEMKSGNYFNFLDNNVGFKINFEKDFEKQIVQFDSIAKSRILFNISSINFNNFDSIGIKRFKKILNLYIKTNLNDSSSFEDVLYNLTFSLFNDTAIKLKNNAIKINNFKLLSKIYIPPFITQFELENIPLFNELKEYLYASTSERYDSYTGEIIQISSHLNTLFDYKSDVFVEIDKLHNLTYNRYKRSVNLENEKIVDSVVKQLDSVRYNSEYIQIEPNWLFKKKEIARNTGDPIHFIQEILNSKYTNSSWLIGYEYAQQLDSTYRLTDYHKCIDDANIYHGLDYLISYFLSNKDSLICTDTSVDNRINKIYVLLNHIVTNGYLNKTETYDKKYLKYQLDKYIYLIEEILFRKKDFELYEKICKIDDRYFLKDKLEDIDDILYPISNKARYLAFVNSSSADEILKFDTTFANTYLREINKVNKDSTLSFFKTYFLNTTCRDIIFDVFNRKNVTDSICLKLLAINDLLVNTYSESFINQEIDVELSENKYLLNRYSNPMFCINNENLDTKKYINNQNPYNQIEKLFLKEPESIINKIDTSKSVLMYIISNELSKYDLNDKDVMKSISQTKLCLYGSYSNTNDSKLIRLITLDSLNQIFNFAETKENNFFATKYFQILKMKSNQLYDILLKPFESFLKKDTSVKLILPDGINSIPIDYLYALKNNSFKNFIEYGSLYKAAFTKNNNDFLDSDSAAIFSEMRYNNIYCNLNKSTNVKTRSSISPLTYSSDERNQIAEYLKSKSFVNEYASKESFINTLISSKFPIIHLITHGSYITTNSMNEIMLNNPSLSMASNDERQVLLFSSDSTSKNNKHSNNILTAMEARYFENLSNIKLIFLSACETGANDLDEYSKTGYQGFVNNFLERGVKSVIATRWKVSDKYSVEFASKYYENLTKIKNFQRAFFETKKYFFKYNTPPYLWTSYVFVQ